VLEFLTSQPPGFQTPNSKLLGSTTGIIVTAVVASILLVLLLAPVFWAAARPDVRRPGQPRPLRPADTIRRRLTAAKESEGQGHWPAERIEDRHIRDDGSHRGKPASWVLVAVMLAAFLAGGIALITHTYWLLWTCAAVFVLGIPVGKAIGIMADTVEWGSSEVAQYGTEAEASERTATSDGRLTG
jgi:hypothetical protein